MHRHLKHHHLITLTAAAAALLAGTPAMGQAERDLSPQVRQAAEASETRAVRTPQDDERQYRMLLGERDRLARQLYELDRRAAAAMLAGSEPTGLYSDQLAAQDSLDRVELRLQLVAMRVGRAVPPRPTEPASPLAAQAVGSEPDYSRAFDRGRDRAVRVLRQQTVDLLASLDLDPMVRAAAEQASGQ
jgi:hypothetical protein